MKIVHFLLAGLLLLTGCDFVKETAGVLGDLNQLRSELTAKTSCDVNLNLNNGSHLAIGLLNSRLKSLPAEQKQALTREIARFALAHYRAGGNLETINVGFVTRKSFLVFNYTDATDNYPFTVAELKSGEPQAAR